LFKQKEIVGKPKNTIQEARRKTTAGCQQKLTANLCGGRRSSNKIIYPNKAFRQNPPWPAANISGSLRRSLREQFAPLKLRKLPAGRP
jgi:hypothetical protein